MKSLTWQRSSEFLKQRNWTKQKVRTPREASHNAFIRRPPPTPAPSRAGSLRATHHSLQGFPPIATEPLGNTTNWVALVGVLWHRNSDLVVICMFIATKILSCNIYFLFCNRLTLMHPLWWFVLHLVGNTSPPFLRCISMLWVAIESCYGHRTRLGCAWMAISQCLIWVANISLWCCNRLALMHPLFRIVLNCVGNTATLFLRCTRNSRVAIETFYGYHTRVGCVWTAISQRLIWVANISLRCWNTRKAIALFLASWRNIVYVLPRNLFWWKKSAMGL
jgi:hypothetical protein